MFNEEQQAWHGLALRVDDFLIRQWDPVSYLPN